MSYCGDRRVFGMAVVTAPSSASLTLAQLIVRSCARRSTERFSISAFRSDSHNSPCHLSVHSENSKPNISLHATGTDSPPCALELDFNEAAAKLESIYKLSPVPVADPVKRKRQKRKVKEEKIVKPVVRNLLKKPRLTLHKRRELKQMKEAGIAETKNEDERIEELVREYSSGTDIGTMDWKKMKIPPVLVSSEHEWLFGLVEPMKNLLQERENLRNAIGREPNDCELAETLQMGVTALKKQMTVGHAARNKLIKHNLRLVLFVVKKYFPDNRRFHDLCQEGAKGLIVAIDRFEPKRKAKLSTYSLFWIRHAVVRSLTVSSFTRVSFGLETVRAEIQKAKLELLVKLQRQPSDEEIIQKTGITQQRYLEVMRASAHVASLNTKHVASGEEWINSVTENEGDVNGRQRAMSRLALDDVLDSLKPKESLVIRQRYGLDGKGDRTLSEIAGNLSISREMVRKYEVKALMKLKHPTRVDYLRRCVVSSNSL